MMRSTLRFILVLSLSNPLLPEITGRELGAVGERREFCPCNLWMDSSTEATVGAGNHIFAADNLCKTHDPIRDEARMLDHVRRMTDHSGNENLVLRQFYFLPHAPFVLMADIARLDRVGLRANGEHEVDNVGNGMSVVCGPCQLPQQM